jgi:hypothetical protein
MQIVLCNCCAGNRNKKGNQNIRSCQERYFSLEMIAIGAVQRSGLCAGVELEFRLPTSAVD